jgi:hypothetical protein
MTEIDRQILKSATLRAQNLCATLNMGGSTAALQFIIQGTTEMLQRLEFAIEQAGPSATFTPADTGRLGTFRARVIAAQNPIPDDLPEWMDGIPGGSEAPSRSTEVDPYLHVATRDAYIVALFRDPNSGDMQIDIDTPEVAEDFDIIINGKLQELP